MAIVTPEQYYSDSDNFGNYQYVTLKHIVDDLLLEAQQEDNYIKHYKRYLLVKYTRDAVKEVVKRTSREVMAIEMTVPDSLTFALPQDYVNWVRVSVVVVDSVNGSKYLQPLDSNSSINTSIGYLQDNNGEILFDNDGYILTSDSDNGYGQPYRKYPFMNCGSQFRLDSSKLSEYGEFKVDDRRGQILFSSELGDREVVLEYLSDGLRNDLTEEEITIHKDLVNPIKDYVYYIAIERSRNVPANEKERARRKYQTSRHLAVLDQSNIDLLQIKRALQGNSF